MTKLQVIALVLSATGAVFQVLIFILIWRNGRIWRKNWKMLTDRVQALERRPMAQQSPLGQSSLGQNLPGGQN